MKRAFFLGVSAMALACSTSAWADPAGAHRCAAHGAKSRQHNCPRPRRAAASDGVHEEIAQLRAEIADLRQQLAEQSAATTRLAAAPPPAAPVPALAADTASATAIASLTQQNEELTRRIDKMEKPDHLPFKGIRITPGGFVEMTSIYRSNNTGADIASSFNNIPFPQSRVANTHEYRMTARQSRLSLLAEGDPGKQTHLAMYGEFDFQAAGVTANSNQTNSYSPRIRHLYGTVDEKLNDDVTAHLLFGQNWSLATMNGKGITPRNEVTPPVVEAQYVPGFVFTRQPQLRLTVDVDRKWWFALSLENPQTTFGGTVPAIASLVTTVPAGSGFGGNGISENALSINHYPDVIGKVAYEGAYAGGRTLHVEAFGMVRDFYERLDGANRNFRGWGVGGGIATQIVPGLLDVQFSGIVGRGIGRYGASALPDVTFNPDGTLAPVREYMLLGGLTAHPTRTLDIYVFGGEESEDAHYATVGGINYGLGNPNFIGAGCLIEGSSLPCTVQTRAVKQLTAGFWQRMMQGPWGRVQAGIQYSHTLRDTFEVTQGGAPTAKEDIGFFSLRYYPF